MRANLTPIITLLATSASCLLTAAPAPAPAQSFLPREKLGQLMVDRLDITTFRSSLGTRRSPGMRHFADLGMKPTKVTDKLVEFDTADWSYHLTVVERGDRNGDGIEDLVVQLTDQAKQGTYNTSTKLLVTRFDPAGDLIALAFEP